MKTIQPWQTAFAYWNNDGNQYSNLVPTVNQFDHTTNLLGFTVTVPGGERWLMSWTMAAWIQGPNVPTYQTAFGLCLVGATILLPPTVAGPTPWSYWHSVIAQGDAAWGSCAGCVWINPGATSFRFGVGRDAGALNIARRQLSANPIAKAFI